MKTRIMRNETADDQYAEGPASRPGESAVQHDHTTRSTSVEAPTDSPESRTTTRMPTQDAGG